MNQYTFTCLRNANIIIVIKAQNFTEAMDLLISTTRSIDDYRLTDSIILPQY